MAEMIQKGMVSARPDWIIDCIGLNNHPEPGAGLLPRLWHRVKEQVKLHAPAPIRSGAAALRVRSWQSHFAQILERQRPRLAHADLVHCLDPVAYRAFLSLKLPRLPMVFSDHSPGSFAQLLLRYVPDAHAGFAERYLLDIERTAFLQSDAVILISQGQLQLKLCEVPGMDLPDGRVRVIYNGIPDLEEPAPAPMSDPIIGFVGALTTDKGIDLLVDAFSEVVVKHPQARLMVIGAGPLRDVIERHRHENILLMGQRGDVPRLLRHLSIFVSCGRRSGFDLAILEALRAGLCVVVSNVGGNAEAVGDAGIVLPNNTVHDLAACLINLISDSEARSGYAQKGKARFKHEFRCEVMAERYAEVYDEVVTRNRPKIRSSPTRS